MSDETKEAFEEPEQRCESADSDGSVETVGSESDPEGFAQTEKQPKKKNGFFAKLDSFFGITASGSTFKVEIIAGLTTFMAMVYILMVNADMFKLVVGAEEVDSAGYGAAYIATAIGAVAGTLFMALLAKMPLAQASGMGVNAFIVYSLVLGGTGLTYANCMVFTLLDGVVFVILTVTGLRKKIFDAIPAAVRHAIPVGIGLFIAFIGLQNAGLVVNDDSTLVGFASFNVLGGAPFGTFIPPFVALVGVLAIAVMSKKNVKGSILWGILGSAVLFYALNGIGCAFENAAEELHPCLDVFTSVKWSNPFSAFANWGKYSAGKVFTQGFNFSTYLGMEGNNAGTLVVLLITTALSLCMIDMFDTIGTLYGACSKGNLLDENGTPIRMSRMMTADAVATCLGAVAGTSTVTTFVESSSGVAAGGKTGFTALVTAAFFLIAMFLSPIAQLIPGCATAAALIWVGVLMMSSVVKIDWENPAESIVAFLTFIVMVLGYSISKGIGIGIVAYVLVMLCTGKVKEIRVSTWIIGALFLATFLLT